MKKIKRVTVRKLTGLTPQLTEMMIEQVGMDKILAAARMDKINGIYSLIRPELPSGVTDSEVREVTNALEEAVQNAVLMPAYYTSRNRIYLSEQS